MNKARQLTLLLALVAPSIAAALDSGWRAFTAPQALDLPDPSIPAASSLQEEVELSGAEIERYGFSPQAGLLARDALLVNYVDLDPATGDAAILDWDCSRVTYDGHQGHDLTIRGFREQAIGVPIFAALPGRVLAVADGFPDDSIDWVPRPGNHVVLDHGGGHVTRYFHIRTGSALVTVGDQVAAGQQLASVGSSGISKGPHLHFETLINGVAVEPSTGPCNPGESLWDAQPPVSREVYVREAFFSPQPFPDFDDPDALRRAILLDQRPRLGSAILGQVNVYLWIEIINLPGGSRGRGRLLDPTGAVRVEAEEPFGLDSFARWASFDIPVPVVFDRLGEWRLVLEVLSGDDTTVVLDTRLRVARSLRAAKNRPPLKIAARLGASKADSAKPTLCAVETPFPRRDPEHDLVSYSYEWWVGSRSVRKVHSAALSDLLPAGAATSKDRVRCRVRPFDGSKFGPAAEARTR